MNYDNLYNVEYFNKFKKDIEKLINADMYAKAECELAECLKSCKDHPGIYHLNAELFLNAQRYDKALTYIQKALQFEKNNDEYLSVAGRIYYYLNDMNNSYTYSTKANEINCNNIISIVTLGLLAFEHNDMENAVIYANEAIKKDENNYDGIRLLSRCYIKADMDADTTVKILKKARTLKNDDDVNIDIMKTLYLSSKFDLCKKEALRIISKNPSSLAAQKAQQILIKIKRENKKNMKSSKNEVADQKNSDEKRESGSLEESLSKLNSLTGLSEVKDRINKIVKLVQFEKTRNKVLNIETVSNQGYHMMFLGNPGTGKTTVARLIADIFYYLGILDKGQLIECDRSSIVGEYVGQTAKLTKKAIDDAMGGVLFIDEAYSLARSKGTGNDFGPEAIDTLIKGMEDNKGKFTVILAGYTKEMRDLMKLNPGLKSRINLDIQFDDYSEDELLEIGQKIAQKNYYSLTDDGKQAFKIRISKLKVDDSFANGREARNLIEEAIRERAFRIGGKKVDKKELSILTSEDFNVDLKEDADSKVKYLLDELNNMTGLYEVKDMINKIVGLVKMQKKRKERQMPCDEISLNMVFKGNPGTGKTTVARIVSRIFKELDILKKGNLVEVSREDLVGRYVGETAIKTVDKIKEAYGGVLFIDEAYSLNSGSNNDFGAEAIAALIKQMEDNRDKLCVIMAGYTDEMNEFLKVNPGTTSRIGFEINFADYNPSELLEIFDKLIKKGGYKIDEDAQQKVKSIFITEFEKRDKNFGNARFVRQFFEKIKMKQAERVMSSSVSEDQIFNIILQDIV